MKKRFICIALTVVFIACSIVVSAEFRISDDMYMQRDPNAGKILGQYYTTDIRAYLNYTEIESYNIGGRTLVCVEDFAKHGFTAYWEPLSGIIEARPTRPYPADKGNRDFGKPTKTVKTGQTIGNYYHTQVRAFVNSQQMESYNIGGRTLVCIEDLSLCGFNVYWNAVNRTIAANIQSPAENRAFGQAQKVENYLEGGSTVKTVHELVGICYPEITYRGYDPDGRNVSYRGFVCIRLYFDEKVSEKTIKSVLNKRYFPVLNEKGEDISDNFNYMFSRFDTSQSSNLWEWLDDKQIWDLAIALSPEFLYKGGYDSPKNTFYTGEQPYFIYYSKGIIIPESCYTETVRIYIPEDIADGMVPNFSFYYECQFMAARIPALYYGYGIYEEFFEFPELERERFIGKK